MSKITVKEFSTNLDKFRVPLSSFEREKRKGLIPYYGAAKIIDYVDGFTHTGLSVLIAEDGSVETKNGYPVVQLANGEYWVNNHTHVLKGGDDIDTTYLYYALQTIKVAPFVTGAVQKKISQQALNSMEIPYFEDKTDRKRIVEILSSFDEKIQLNTQINQTLEQIAQALFKSWFVDFDPVRAKVQALSDGLSLEQAELAAMQAISGKTPEELTALSQTQPDRYAELAETAKAFPCEMVEVDGVEVPRGWEYKPADELFDIGIGKTPLRKETEWFSTNPDDMQWISIKDMGNSGVFITESSELLTNQAVDKFNIRKIPEDTVLLSFKLTIGRVSITMCETTTNEAIAHFKITDKSFLTTEYLYLFFQQFDFNSLGSTSSIATAVNSKTIKGIEILIPNEELIKTFQMKISNIFAQIKNLTIENKNLVETRDLLLPKLLNGEI
ncbi:TPA: restriction endonuclease subunit S [Haemophilus influenzae]|uniref:restriction endonuclease subunit S n=1 Tax=Haemophilus influenzae TaxID=727 RepID=UPI002A3196F4|nr:restriction endonuclease subunit S [Haemophilus influenzae]MCK9075576.1 restriction endonuclease subunit S [Haemophilus influenzae]